MAKCLYSGDKPLGLVQSNAEDIAYSTGGGISVKDKIDTKADNTWKLIGWMTSEGLSLSGLTIHELLFQIYNVGKGTCFGSMVYSTAVDYPSVFAIPYGSNDMFVIQRNIFQLTTSSDLAQKACCVLYR